MRHIQISQSIINRESLSAELYFDEIGKVPLITTDDEVVLAQKIKQGDEAALEKLTKANLRFVVSTAKKYQQQGLPLSDLINEGNLGSVKAARRFDETRGFKFISMAVWWIRQSILSAIAENTRMVRLPRSQINLLTKMNRRAAELENQLEHQPMDEELAGVMEIVPARVTDARYCSGRTASYDMPLTVDNDFLFIETFGNGGGTIEDVLLQESEMHYLESLLHKLTPRERTVIELTYGLTGDLEYSPIEIAPVIKLSAERAKQIRNKALKKLKSII
jgi:RNA polymerase primary sigma factor